MTFARLPLAFVLCAAWSVVTSAAGSSESSVPEAIDKFLMQSSDATSYRATRRLEATGSGQRGWLDAHTDFTPGRGFSYVVTAEGGSGVIRSRVLKTLLEEERRLLARGAAGEVALSRANYGFEPDGVDDAGLIRVTLRPARKERQLIVGRMFLRPDDGELVRVEGRLAKNPSFWVTRVNIVRSYARINGTLVPVLLESTAQLRFLGASTLRMTYRYTEVDGRPAPDLASAPGQETLRAASVR